MDSIDFAIVTILSLKVTKREGRQEKRRPRTQAVCDADRSHSQAFIGRLTVRLTQSFENLYLIFAIRVFGIAQGAMFGEREPKMGVDFLMEVFSVFNDSHRGY
jgi:hypothetical protein